MQVNYEDLVNDLVEIHIHLKKKLIHLEAKKSYNWQSTKSRHLIRVALRQVENDFNSISTLINNSILKCA